MAYASDLNCSIEGRPSNFSECSSFSSVSDHEEFTPNNQLGSVRRSRKWRRALKKLVEESKKRLYGSSKSSVFSYDAVSYSLNFDDGNHSNDRMLFV